MKDGLSEAAISRIAESLARLLPDFPKASFIAEALSGLQPLELKARVRHIMGVLKQHLPDDFSETAAQLIQLKEVWIPGDPDDNLSGFAAWPIIDYIGKYGMGHPEKSLVVLKELTSLFSAEFAIRPFIINHFDLTFRVLERWCQDPDEHVRRLVSEGSRPRLPWGQQLPQLITEPSPVFALLAQLKDDPSEYVRRSVANNLNDISKDHPKQVIACCRRWQKGAGPERKKLIRHATRTLVKAGHPDVFALLGYTENPRLVVQSLEVSPKTIQLGEAIEFTLHLQSTNSTPQTFVIDYAIHHMKANGRTSPKVFKFRTLELPAGETAVLTKRHAIKPISTRTYYSGKHEIEILINGKTFGRAAFTLRLN